MSTCSIPILFLAGRSKACSATRSVRRLLCAAVLGLCGLLAATAASSNDRNFKTYGPFAVQSNGLGQVSSAIYSIETSTSGELRIDFVAPRTHCAKLVMHFLLDGKEKAVSGEVAAGGHSGYVDLGPVASGNHVIGLRAEGIMGGCDAGTLVSWGGSAVVWTSPFSSDGTEAHLGQLGDLVFEVGYVNYARGYVNRGHVIAGDGSLYSYEYARNDAQWNPKPDSSGLISELDLLEKYGHNRMLLGQVSTNDLAAKQRLAWMIGEENLAHSPRPRNMANDAGETTYVVYRRNPNNGDYERVLLGENGDWCWVNTAASAEALRSWLDQTLKAAISNSRPETAAKP